MLQYLVILGALVNFFGSLPYVIQTLKAQTKPNKISWGMWSVAPLIATAAALYSGAGWAALPVFMSGFMPLVIFVVSFINPNAYWKLELFDYLCGICSVLALILWAITKQPVIAVIFAIASDFLAGVPTLIKGWQHPETESGFVFFAGLINAATALFAVRSWTFAQYGFPIYLMVMNTLLFSSIWHSKLKRFFFRKSSI